VALQRKSVKAKAFAKAVEIGRKSGQIAKELLPFEGACGVQTLYMTQHAIDEKNTHDGESARHLTSGFH
jgi:hypothetical protein